jgi:hypothetical protein
LLGITFLVASIAKLLEVLWMVKFDIHLKIPLVFLRLCQILLYGATLF